MTDTDHNGVADLDQTPARNRITAQCRHCGTPCDYARRLCRTCSRDVALRRQYIRSHGSTKPGARPCQHCGVLVAPSTWGKKRQLCYRCYSDPAVLRLHLPVRTCRDCGAVVNSGVRLDAVQCSVCAERERWGPCVRARIEAAERLLDSIDINATYPGHKPEALARLIRRHELGLVLFPEPRPYEPGTYRGEIKRVARRRRRA